MKVRHSFLFLYVAIFGTVLSRIIWSPEVAFETKSFILAFGTSFVFLVALYAHYSEKLDEEVWRKKVKRC